MPKYMISIPLEGGPFPAPIDASPLPLEAGVEIDIISSHDDRILEVLPGAVPIIAPQQNSGAGA